MGRDGIEVHTHEFSRLEEPFLDGIVGYRQYRLLQPRIDLVLAY